MSEDTPKKLTEKQKIEATVRAEMELEKKAEAKKLRESRSKAEEDQLRTAHQRLLLQRDKIWATGGKGLEKDLATVTRKIKAMEKSING